VSIERACIYCRGFDGLASQAGFAAAYIVGLGLQCTQIYVDEQGFDSWQKIAEECSRENIDAVIIKNLDALTEDENGIESLEEMLPIPIIGAEDSYCSKENLNIETLQYEKPRTGNRREQKQELENYRQTSLNDDEQSRYFGGRAPFGYSRKGGKLVHDPITSPAVERVFTMAMGGLSMC